MMLSRLPRELSRRARAVLLAAQWVADPESGEVTGGQQAIADVLGIEDKTRRSIGRALAELEENRLVRRGGNPVGARIFVRTPAFSPGGCSNCYTPIKAGRWCAKCRQSFRADRAWQLKAIQLHVDGKTPAEIAVACDRPLWRTHEDDQRRGGVAIVPFLLEQGLLGPKWRKALSAALAGEE